MDRLSKSLGCLENIEVPSPQKERRLAWLEIWALEVDVERGEWGCRRELNTGDKRITEKNGVQERVEVSGAAGTWVRSRHHRELGKWDAGTGRCRRGALTGTTGAWEALAGRSAADFPENCGELGCRVGGDR